MCDWVCPQCGKQFRHQSALSRHIHGNPKQRYKPCNVKSRVPPWLKPHRGCDEFPEFLTNSLTDEILGGSVHNVVARLLKEIHLRPDFAEARPYCNVVWLNANRPEVSVFDGTSWVIKPFKNWLWGFCGWVYRTWNTRSKHLTAQQDAFLRFFAKRQDNDPRWVEMEKTVRSLLLNGVIRDLIKRMFSFR